MREAVIGLGSNLENREGNIRKAIKALGGVQKLKIEKISYIYETLPFGVPDTQKNYYNCCMVVKTQLPPEILLGVCLGIEATLGRVRTYKNAARVIDLDLLLYEREFVCTCDLKLPHTEIKKRAFVLVPLQELYPKGLPQFFGLDLHGIEINYNNIISKKALSL